MINKCDLPRCNNRFNHFKYRYEMEMLFRGQPKTKYFCSQAHAEFFENNIFDWDKEKK